MTESRFFDGIFQLADLWTTTVDAVEYTNFLRDLLGQLKLKGRLGQDPHAVACTAARDAEGRAAARDSKGRGLAAASDADEGGRRARMRRASSDATRPATVEVLNGSRRRSFSVETMLPSVSDQTETAASRRRRDNAKSVDDLPAMSFDRLGSRAGLHQVQSQPNLRTRRDMPPEPPRPTYTDPHARAAAARQRQSAAQLRNLPQSMRMLINARSRNGPVGPYILPTPPLRGAWAPAPKTPPPPTY